MIARAHATALALGTLEHLTGGAGALADQSPRSVSPG